MKFAEPFGFWAIQPDGERAYQAYEHVHSYCEGASIQYARVYELWQQSSSIKVEGDLAAIAEIKRSHMQQVIRDIHCLLVFLQVIWKTLQVMSAPDLYPHFTAVAQLRDKWRQYFEQYRAARNTFEHYEDQVLGRDSRENSPGWGLSLSATDGFSLGMQQRVSIDKIAYEQLRLFIDEFDDTIAAIVESAVPPGGGGGGPTGQPV
jgi:hypothetical protein